MIKIQYGLCHNFSKQRGDSIMKKFLALLLTTSLLAGMLTTTAYAANTPDKETADTDRVKLMQAGSLQHGFTGFMDPAEITHKKFA